MKFNIEIKNIATIEVECSLSEVRGLYEIQEECLEKLPKYLDECEKAFRKFKRIERGLEEDFPEEFEHLNSSAFRREVARNFRGLDFEEETMEI